MKQRAALFVPEYNSSFSFTLRNSLKDFSFELKEKLLHELVFYEQNIADRAKRFQRAGLLCKKYLAGLYEQIFYRGIENREEEILFFKTLKPLFGAELEYFHRMFQLELIDRKNTLFYNREIKRTDKILEQHQSFAAYFFSGQTDKDYQYFAQGYRPVPTGLCVLCWDDDPRVTSKYDNWISGLLATQRYREELITRRTRFEMSKRV